MKKLSFFVLIVLALVLVWTRMDRLPFERTLLKIWQKTTVTERSYYLSFHIKDVEYKVTQKDLARKRLTNIACRFGWVQSC